MRTHIKILVDNNWLDERNNPKYKWDRTLQYRVNIKQIQIDLYKLGYVLEDYPLQFNPAEITISCNRQKGKMDKEKSKNHSGKKEKAIPETTTEITTKTTNKNGRRGATSACSLDPIENTIKHFYKLLARKPGCFSAGMNGQF